jgi:hypothetical protein
LIRDRLGGAELRGPLRAALVLYLAELLEGRVHVWQILLVRALERLLEQARQKAEQR